MKHISEKDYKQHWNKTYDRVAADKLGWYENNPVQSLQLIEKCKLEKNARILNVGVGASTLIDELIKLGYNNLIANDISSSAMEKLKLRLGEKENKIEWLVDDLTNATYLKDIGNVDLWHDRAVLHFFNSEHEQSAYFNLLKELVKLGAYVIIAAFNLNGAKKCSGLPVFRYNTEMIKLRLGQEFELIESYNHTYEMPSGDLREYIYTLFKRTEI